MPAFPLSVHSSGRYLVDANGTPFLFHGDTAWSLIVELSLADAGTYLDDCRARGFNSIIVNLIEHGFSSHTPIWRNANGDLPFDGSNNYDNRTAAYFSHARDVISAAEARGLLVVLNPSYVGFDGGTEGWYADMVSNGTTKMRSYGQYIGTTFASHKNILWCNAGDYNPANEDVVDQLALGIVDNDTAKLHTAHCAPESSAMDVWSAKSWLSLNTTYSYSTVLYQKLLADYNRGTVKPYILFESRYENEDAPNGTPFRCRRQAWQAMTCGACGHFYGNNPIWKFASGWDGAEGIGDTGRLDMPHVYDLLAHRRWWTLAPDDGHTFMTSAYGTDGQEAYATAAKGSDGKLALVYVPAVLSPVVNLAQLSGPVTVRRYDPTDGSTTTLGLYGNTQTLTLTHAGNNAAGDSDWVYLFEVVPTGTVVWSG